MGVYIKGMEMPKACAFCRIKRRNGKKMVCPLLDEEWDIHDPMSADHRLDNCPLVPVHPHGRLVDADAIRADVDEKRPGRSYEDAWALTVLDSAPTILEGEE